MKSAVILSLAASAFASPANASPASGCQVSFEGTVKPQNWKEKLHTEVVELLKKEPAKRQFIMDIPMEKDSRMFSFKAESTDKVFEIDRLNFKVSPECGLCVVQPFLVPTFIVQGDGKQVFAKSLSFKERITTQGSIYLLCHLMRLPRLDPFYQIGQQVSPPIAAVLTQLENAKKKLEVVQEDFETAKKSAETAQKTFGHLQKFKGITNSFQQGMKLFQ